MALSAFRACFEAAEGPGYGGEIRPSASRCSRSACSRRRNNGRKAAQSPAIWPMTLTSIRPHLVQRQDLQRPGARRSRRGRRDQARQPGRSARTARARAESAIDPASVTSKWRGVSGSEARARIVGQAFSPARDAGKAREIHAGRVQAARSPIRVEAPVITTAGECSAFGNILIVQ